MALDSMAYDLGTIPRLASGTDALAETPLAGGAASAASARDSWWVCGS
jgi:hypothetical protein